MLKGLTAAAPIIINNNLDANVQTIMLYIDKAHAQNARLVLFPETCLTGLVNTDNYEQDKHIALELTSKYILQIREKAMEKGMWVAFGFFEIENGVIYDTAVLVNNAGEIVLHQRRTSRGWRASNLPKEQYAEGTTFETTETPWGKTGFLICGDLFDKWETAREAKLNLLLFPFARCFNNGVEDFEKEWTKEWPDYAKQINKVNADLTLGANYISRYNPSEHSDYFGGAFVADKNRKQLASLPLNQEGLLGI